MTRGTDTLGTGARHRVITWADGFGRWYASVPGDAPNPRRLAREAIRRELTARGTVDPNWRVRVEPAPDYWLSAPREVRPVFREASE